MRNLIIKFILSASLINGYAWAARIDLVCESGQPMSVAGDYRIDNIISVLWGGKVYQMARVRSSTGAHRFEDAQSGLIWIGIPAKAMLLDSRRGAPVVNDCKAGMAERPRR